MIRDILTNSIRQALGALEIEVPEIILEHPTGMDHGDYATSVAMVAAKKVKENPKELAQKIADKISENKDKYIEKVTVAGPGFINFYLTDEFFVESLNNILSQKDDFGRNQTGQGKTTVVEYSSPNIAKPFTVGHLRSTIIGDAIANLLEFSSYKVIRDNHLGDWGTQFGKLMVAIKKWGNLEEIKKTPEPIKSLVALYIQFHDETEKEPTLEDEARVWFAKLEQGDEEAKQIWQTCVDLSLVEFAKIYKRLGVEFDTTHGESFFIDKIQAVHDELARKNLLTDSEGAKVVMFPEKTKLPPFIIEKSDGSSIYAARDLAADWWRRNEYQPSVIINEVGSEQTLYFRQLFETEKMVGWFEEGERVHVVHGLYRFAEGKMSTRRGDVIWLEEVLDEVTKRASEFNPTVAEAVGVGAIKYNDLKRESQLDVIFDWGEILNLKGNSGPYLQYTNARTNSVLEKAGGVKDFSIVPRPTAIEKLLYRFPEVVERAAGEYAPHHVCNYLYELAGAFNAYYADRKIVSDEPESAYRLALTAAVGQVLRNGLNLLGISAPEKM